jgi:hypothetical protein
MAIKCDIVALVCLDDPVFTGIAIYWLRAPRFVGTAVTASCVCEGQEED